MEATYPQWICARCGLKHGNRLPGLATYHVGKCGVCDKDPVAVTEPRDYGHLAESWKTQTKETK